MNQPLTDQQKAAQAAALARATQQMKQRVGQSVYNERGELDIGAAQRAANGGSIGLGEYLDLSLIPSWAPEPDSRHNARLAQLVQYMGELPEKGWGGVIGGPLSVSDRKLLHATAILYGIGRATGEERYAERSAAFAEKFFRDGGGSGTYWSTPEVREETCRLIYRHTDERAIKEDKRLQVFADGLRYELARIEPNTARGFSIIKTEWEQEKFWLAWSSDRGNLRHYMLQRGWK